MNRRARRFERGFNSEPLAVLPAPPRRQSLRQRGRGNTGGILFRNRQRTGQGAVYQVQITFRELTQHLDKDLRGGSSPSATVQSHMTAGKVLHRKKKKDSKVGQCRQYAGTRAMMI
ncbi:uncharacterized protein si:ch211-152f22.4 isoform X3 [Esox lucius]|uniref:uncharacterized protein si:ch211-152f22.4 isoform X3 n=1 Tax=Esox lucius TaxID=8010 RepID=UPI001476B929|nr:uncharacterized protein si:ch211-152f22.4 isoform X3 [Esox lucius]